ncbi:MAG: hypothetical protein PHX40_01850 [Bacilli bacterium]|nr:hypothetical protein [Bacilli bacterium]
MIKLFDNAQIGVFSNITKDMTALDLQEIDFITYLGTVLSVKSSDYLKYRNSSLTRDTKAPFYMQDLVSKIIYATIFNPDLFQETFNIKRNVYNKDGSLITIVLGSAGSGKTTAIMGSVIDIIRQNNPKSNI